MTRWTGSDSVVAAAAAARRRALACRSPARESRRMRWCLRRCRYYYDGCE